MIGQLDVHGLLQHLDRSKLYDLFPDEGPVRRELYPRHLEFFKAGALHLERAIIGGNRVGKSLALTYEATCHLIGWYPPWWEGRRFHRPVVAWMSGEDAKAVRESLQAHFLGVGQSRGTGLIPGDRIIRVVMRAGISDAVDFVEIKHGENNTGMSRLVFKAYEQGRESYQGAKVDIGGLDEEPPLDVYTEQLTRVMATAPGEENGILMMAFTPLRGVSNTVLQFLPGGVMPATEEVRREAWGW